MGSSSNGTGLLGKGSGPNDRQHPKNSVSSLVDDSAIWGFLPNPAKRCIPEGYANRRAISRGTGAATKAYRRCMNGVGQKTPISHLHSLDYLLSGRGLILRRTVLCNSR